MYNGVEKRKHKRIEKSYIARGFKLYVASEDSSATWYVATLNNLSAGGVFFNYRKDLRLGSLLDLRIGLPKSTSTINCVGKVTRIDKSKRTSMLRIAVKFIDIGEQEKELINKAVEGILEY